MQRQFPAFQTHWVARYKKWEMGLRNILERGALDAYPATTKEAQESLQAVRAASALLYTRTSQRKAGALSAHRCVSAWGFVLQEPAPSHLSS